MGASKMQETKIKDLVGQIVGQSDLRPKSASFNNFGPLKKRH